MSVLHCVCFRDAATVGNMLQSPYSSCGDELDSDDIIDPRLHRWFVRPVLLLLLLSQAFTAL